ncbi:hypothetical protein METBIDRAFT_164164 [Metschnikowia bicuspidata var. bicuspidata NRRL YB-4993]|uniref:Transcription initiation factor TFIID subunit 1 histone acetyltransferase domain-containing protein n=1 Tax=Metschnikowia bicuspidata var. bicuspidata NRRL YB-4993 TaxID=869754 RepID=A0A1A0HF53_9ASCO|nr:hypothetical protein METBIDRAFT_164164 [Metschnikowia bicuspidata var. bicuspidata NRRL YB-4993]OBA22631.1 hypothetical protein METBIDRAFT_164164 [Metschnikowia bicuspidata var. bicuspidata NRRL YB-4993]
MAGNGMPAASADDVFALALPGNDDVPDDKMIDDIFAERTTKHADDAVDYEDIDELADDDDDLPEEHLAVPATGAGGALGRVLAFEETGLQNDAENEFDALFGDENAPEHGHGGFVHADVDLAGPVGHAGLDILHDMGPTAGHEDDGLNDLGLGFEDETSTGVDPAGRRPGPAATAAPRKRKSPDVVAAKTAKLRRLVHDMEARQKARMVRRYFSAYSAEKPFNFHDMVLPEPRYYAYKRPAIAFKSHPKPLVPLKISLDIEPDQKRAFKSRKGVPSEPACAKGVSQITQQDLDFIEGLHSTGDPRSRVKVLPIMEQDGVENDKFSDFSKDLVLATADWDDNSIISAGNSETEEAPARAKLVTDSFEMDDILYDDENILNAQISQEKFELNMNDPHLLFVPDVKRIEHTKSKAVVPSDNKLLHQKFNVSNDKAYEIFENNYNTKVRSQLSNLNIEHSIPALRLQTPYYKIKLSREESRAFHRPKFQVIQGSLICFSKPRLRKKKKDRGKTPQEVFSRTNDLSVADSATLIAMEYSEEYPSILSNFGMGSKMINYYRKEKEEDNTRPKALLGETHVLGVEDRSPFWNFGHVAKGDFVPTLYNNMIRAPIFKQESKSTDFLLIRSQGCGNHQRYFLRRIDHLFAVGNIFPAVEVPAPHSRKVTNTSKNRLKMIVFRTMNQNGTARLSVKDISLHFPDQNDMQNRQRLKEFMEYQRQGDDQGFWKIRGADAVPTEEEIKSMITPEDAALLDCMQHGQQVLDDIESLYNDDARKLDFRKDKKENEKEDIETDEKKELEKKKDKNTDIDETIDEGLTPWSSSRSFIISNQTKAMLQLNGEGDPTGIGLGFSFLRATQKHGFKPLIPPPKDTVPKNTTASYQQKLYENEISRIWYGQRSSLTVDNTEGHSLDDIYREYKPLDHTKYIKSKIDKEREDIVKNEGQKAANQNVLKITRLVRDENNIVQRKVEYLHDPRLIKAYIKRKKQIEGDKMSMADVNEIIPTNDAEMNKIRRKALEEKIANLQKRAKLSKGRKPNKDPLHLAAAAGGTIIDANTVMLPDGSIAFGGKGIGKGKSTTRRCKSCGAFGHIRTNKACPLYHATKGGTIQIPQEQKDILLASAKDRPEGFETATSGNETPAVELSAAGSPAAPTY